MIQNVILSSSDQRESVICCECCQAAAHYTDVIICYNILARAQSTERVKEKIQKFKRREKSWGHNIWKYESKSLLTMTDKILIVRPMSTWEANIFGSVACPFYLFQPEKIKTELSSVFFFYLLHFVSSLFHNGRSFCRSKYFTADERFELIQNNSCLNLKVWLFVSGFFRARLLVLPCKIGFSYVFSMAIIPLS